MKGNIYMIAGPSGVGKGTVVKQLMKLDEKLALSVSATTRAPREGEIDGVNYYFLTREKFETMVAERGFLEHAEYVGNCYGTPKQPVIDQTEKGFDVILEIEVQGCAQIMEMLPEAKGIFLLPPSYNELEKRLRGRGTETEEKISKRLETARTEIAQAYRFDHFVINDDVDAAAARILDIIREYRD